MTDLHQYRPVRGILLRVFLSFLIVVGGAAIKLTEGRYPVGQLVFARGVMGLIPLVIWVVWSGGATTFFRTSRLGAHLGRGFLGITAMMLQFAAVSLLPLSDATAILQASPIFVVILAAVLLGERVGIVRWSAVAAGLVGIALISWNYAGFEANETAEFSALGLACAVGAAFIIGAIAVAVRSLTSVEPVGTIVFYYTIILIFGSLMTAPFGWVMPTGLDFLWLALVGLTFGTGQVLLTVSLRFAPASLLAPFDYLSIVWALIIGWFLFGHVPGLVVVLGAVIVVAAGLTIFYREQWLGLRRGHQ